MSCALLRLVEPSALVRSSPVVLSSTCAAGERALQRLAPQGVERDVERGLRGGHDDHRVPKHGTASCGTRIARSEYCTRAHSSLYRCFLLAVRLLRRQLLLGLQGVHVQI